MPLGGSNGSPSCGSTELPSEVEAKDAIGGADLAGWPLCEGQHGFDGDWTQNAGRLGERAARCRLTWRSASTLAIDAVPRNASTATLFLGLQAMRHLVSIARSHSSSKSVRSNSPIAVARL